MKRFTAVTAALFVLGALAVAIPAAGSTSKVTLHPIGFGERTYASWKAQEGQPDTKGNANHALYFQKFTETFVQVAAIAEFQGAGLPLTAVQGQSWEHRNDGWCGAGAPRWTTISTDTQGRRYVTHQECAASLHTPTQPGWTKDTQPSTPATDVCVRFDDPVEVFPAGCPAGNVIQSLWIVFDEGTTLGGLPWPGTGFVYLDNIEVTIDGVPHRWTGPMDNTNN